MRKDTKARAFTIPVKKAIAQRDSIDGWPCCVWCGAAAPEEIVWSNAHFISDVVPDARHMGALAEQSTAQMLDIKQVAYYEPFYLKEFVAAPSHIKGLETK